MSIGRRRFLAAAGACLGQLWLAPREVAALRRGADGRATRTTGGAAGLFRSERVVARAPWGDLVEVAEGVWALISTPLADHPDAGRTLSNGGIVAGSDGVLVIEAFARPEGAAWMADRALELTGRRPERVVLTHHHRDHTAGVPGYFPGGGEGPSVRATGPVKSRLMGAGGVDSARAARVSDDLPTDGAESIDLGGRTVRVVPRTGHTESDVTVEVDDPAVTFCGDLVWNGMFPNYVHATPSHLASAVDAVLADQDRTLIPGHGAIPTREEAVLYRELLGRVENAARRGHEAGHTAAEAADEFTMPEAVADWVFFSDRYVEVAIGAWYAEWAE